VLERVLGALNRIPIGERAVRVGGARLYADSVDRWLAAVAWSAGWLAARERRFLERVLRPGAVAVDVGAYIVFHTLVMARLVGPSGRVHALEPEPRNFRLLARAVAEAGLTQVRLHEVAAAAGPGTLTLHVGAANRGDHRLAPAADARRRLTVRAVAVDALLAGEARVAVVKIDVQGAEVAALAGLGETLARHQGIRLLCELSPSLLARAGADRETFFAPLRAFGLRPHRLERGGTTVPVDEAAAWAAAARGGFETIVLAR
jgi:FkbM family methyltransferase